MTAIKQNAPFRHWIIPGLVPLDECAKLCGSMPASDWAHWVRYNNELERNKRTCNVFDKLPSEIKTVADHINGNGVLQMVRDLSGLDVCADHTLHGAGLHVTDPGGWLQVHVDYQLHPLLSRLERKLNLIVFANPEWRQEWGGELLLCDSSGQSKVRILPMPGAAVLFECGHASFHGVSQVSPDCPVSRVTLAAYYLSETSDMLLRKRALFIPSRTGGVPAELS